MTDVDPADGTPVEGVTEVGQKPYDGGPVPDDWVPDCENCQWFLERYGRENCHMFNYALGLPLMKKGWHVLNNPGTIERHASTD